MVNRVAVTIFIILCLMAVAFPPKTSWWAETDLDSFEVLVQGEQVPADHHVVYTESHEKGSRNPTNLQTRHVEWSPIWRATWRSINIPWLTMEILAAFCLTMIPGLRKNPRARAGALTVAVGLAAAVIIVSTIRDSSFDVRFFSARTQQLRKQAYEQLLIEMTQKLCAGDSAMSSGSDLTPDQSQKYRTAIDSIAVLDRSGEAYISLDRAWKMGPAIMKAAGFYLITMGCVDKVLYSRSELRDDPMVRTLFFSSNGEERKGEARKLGISMLGHFFAEDSTGTRDTKDIWRVDLDKASVRRVPVWWLLEDAHIILLRELVLQPSDNWREEALRIIAKIGELRSSHMHADADSAEARINGLLSALELKMTQLGE
jgi:hypothetical protein